MAARCCRNLFVDFFVAEYPGKCTPESAGPRHLINQSLVRTRRFGILAHAAVPQLVFGVNVAEP